MKHLILKEENKILNISLNKPDIHNAFDPELIQEITDVFSNHAALSKHKIIVFSGNGKSFCAGADLNWMKSMVQFTYEENLIDAEKLYAMFDAIKNCPLPVIGKIHGNVFGGGLGLVAVCDIVAADESTQFCFSEAKLGLVPSVISSFVRRRMLSHHLREVFLTAEIFDSQKALTSGLIHFAGSKNEVDQYLNKKIESILKCGPEAVMVTKKLLNDLENLNAQEIKKETTMVISKKRIGKEGQEGVKAFLEKRKPNWLAELESSKT